MRVAFLTLFLIAVLGVCVAQDTSPQVQTSNNASPANVVIFRQPQSRAYVADRKIRVSPAKQGIACYSMRSYLFTPGSVGEAPKPIGYLTCTPAQSYEMRQTKQPKVRLLPQ
jgi:hypothetical protein